MFCNLFSQVAYLYIPVIKEIQIMGKSSSGERQYCHNGGSAAC